jgi:riboflavin synthase
MKSGEVAMFTGIIEEIGAVARKSGPDLAIMAESVLDGMRIGDSIAVDGVCLTVVEMTDRTFVVQVSPETLQRSTLGRLRPGHAVNLERAMAASGRFGGHFVLGHVDGVGRIESIQDQGPFAVWRFKAPVDVARYLVPKGSVTVDGISLTVIDPAVDTFGVALIPETLRKTSLQSKRVGEAVNLEADMVGKHIFHYLHGGSAAGITREFLSSHGYA